MKELIAQLIKIKDIADGKVSTVSCQGQAMSGYDELAEYRRLIEKLRVSQHSRQPPNKPRNNHQSHPSDQASNDT